MYDSVDQASLRLRDTIVVHDKDFWKVIAVASSRDFARGAGAVVVPPDKPIVLQLHRGNDPNYKYVALDDPDLVFRKYKMGYFNTHRDGAYLLIRNTVRCQSQGLCNANSRLIRVQHPPVIMGNGGSNPMYLANEGLWRSGAKTTLKAYKCLYENDYPSVKGALNILQKQAGDPDGGYNSVAVSRHIAIVQDPDLDVKYVHVRGNAVGTLLNRAGLVLPPRNHFYQEEVSQLFDKITIDEAA